MTPQPLAFLSDRLGLTSVEFDILRRDELSGTGDGRIFQAQLAAPIWTVSLVLHEVDWPTSRGIDARIRALNGSSVPFLFADPTYRGPAKDPGGVVLAGAVVTVSAKSAAGISLVGLPEGYQLVAGDRMSIAYGTDRLYLGEVYDDRAAGETVMAEVPVFPALPMGLEVGAVVTLVRPVLKVIVPPKGHTPFVMRPGFYAQGSTLSLVQKL